MGDERQSEFEYGLIIGQKVIDALKTFAAEIHNRNATRDVLDIVENPNKRFKGGYVGQAPEYFTERFLIEPVLESLLLDPWPRPVDLVKDERNRPDYRLDGVSEDFLAIAESKALNRERGNRKATKDINKYLQDQTFLRTLKRAKVRYSIGIATDGLEWRLIAQDVERKDQIEIGSCSIADQVKTVLKNSHSRANQNSNWVPYQRAEVANSFVSYLHRIIYKT